MLYMQFSVFVTIQVPFSDADWLFDQRNFEIYSKFRTNLPLTLLLPGLDELLQLLYLILSVFELIPLLAISVTTQATNAAVQQRGRIHLDPLTFNRGVQAQLKRNNKCACAYL